MHEFCPVCTKNGIQSKIRSYQLNFTEAVFMCGNEQCTWPAGFQELTFINRPIGENWSSTWDESASEYWKSLPEPVKEFSAYTPPQTPGSEIISKDTTSCITLCPPTVPQEPSDIIPAQKDLFTILDFSNHSYSNDSFIDDSVSNGMDLLPKSVSSMDTDYVLEKSPEKGNVFTNDNDKDIVLCKDSLTLINLESNVSVSHPTSINSKSPLVKHEQTKTTSPPMNEILGKVQRNLKIFNKKKPKIVPYEFDFEELKKKKSTNVEENDKLDLGKTKKVLPSDKNTSSSNIFSSLADKPIIIKDEQKFNEFSLNYIGVNKSFLRSKLANKNKIKPLDFDELFMNKNKNIDEKIQLQTVKSNKFEEKLDVRESMFVDRHNSSELDEKTTVDKIDLTIENLSEINPSVDKCELSESEGKSTSASQDGTCALSEASTIINRRDSRESDEMSIIADIKHELEDKSIFMNQSDSYEPSEASTIDSKRESCESSENIIIVDERDLQESNEKSTSDEDYLDLDIDLDFDSMSPNSEIDKSILPTSSKDSGVGQDDEVMINCNDLNLIYDNNVNNQDVNNSITNYDECMFDDILDSIDAHVKPTSTDEFLDALLEEGDL